jgi:hypothetical protein
LVRSGPGRPTSINLLNGIASPMGQPKTPGTMLQDGHTGANVKVVLAAGTYPWTIVPVPHRSWQGLLSLDKPGDGGGGLRCYESSVRREIVNHGLPQKSDDNEISRECNESARLVQLADGVVGFGESSGNKERKPPTLPRLPRPLPNASMSCSPERKESKKLIPLNRPTGFSVISSSCNPRDSTGRRGRGLSF